MRASMRTTLVTPIVRQARFFLERLTACTKWGQREGGPGKEEAGSGLSRTIEAAVGDPIWITPPMAQPVR